MKIHRISAREILDSRGNPTVSAVVELNDGSLGEASVPSGASTGSREAHELRDNVKSRFGGKGVLTAVSSINMNICPALAGFDSENQAAIDSKLIELDGSPDKSNFGANALLAVSIATAKAEAISRGLELFEYLSLLYGQNGNKKFTMPTPMFNILNGGRHAVNNIDIQETMVVPIGLPRFEEKLRAGAEIYQLLKAELTNRGFGVGLGDEGGFAPDFAKNEDVFEWASRAIKMAGYSKKKVRLATDVAASEFYDEKTGKYKLKSEKKQLTSDQMIKTILNWKKKYELLSVEDGLSENDPNWSKLTSDLAETISIGDDLFTTNPLRIKAGIEAGEATGVIIKPNQIGTLTETLEAIKTAKDGGLKIVVSHRSGETEDSFIADLAVATSADYIKSGAPARSERLAKYNRLTQIEDILRGDYE